MRILHVLDHSLPLHSGYTFRTLAILDEQQRLGWETVHVTSAKHDPEKTQGDIDLVEGRYYYRSPQPSVFERSIPALDQLGVVRTLQKRLHEVIRETRPDIVHAHSPALNGVAARRACNQHRLPLVYELRALWEDGAVDLGKTTEGSLRYRASRRLETGVLRRADAVTTICEGLREDIVARGIPRSQVTVIPNAVDANRFDEPRSERDRLAQRLGLDNCIVLGFLGSFYRWEGLDFLLEALPLIETRHQAIKLLLVGGGPEEQKLRRMADDLGLSDRVVFAGRVPHEDVCSYYDLMDIVVYPRRSMRLTELVTPLKPLEAMARSRIILASDVGGHRELLRETHPDQLFAPERPAALADAVERMLSRRSEWPLLREAARKHVVEERSWARSVARYEAVYRSLLDR